jgi:GTP diphosphokinase / guanosine-3',5'-bis(diphosphate) 3'-diphosphatase
MKKLIDKAWDIAKEVHGNQKRKSGKPQMYHIKEVVKVLKEMGITEENFIITAILHDVLEDCELKMFAFYYNKILDTFGAEILTNVLALTHLEGSYPRYINDLIIEYPNLTIIKLADMIENVTENPSEKQLKKYRKAFPLLVKCLYED